VLCWPRAPYHPMIDPPRRGETWGGRRRLGQRLTQRRKPNGTGNRTGGYAAGRSVCSADVQAHDVGSSEGAGCPHSAAAQATVR